MWKLLDSIVKHIIVGPTAPLTRLQAWTLQCMYIEGLDMKSDARSLRQGVEPRLLYAFYNGSYIGTAYGDSFDVSPDVGENQEVAGIVERIHDAYLSVSPEEQARRDAEEDMYDELIL